jgi:hypothetical protein
MRLVDGLPDTDSMMIAPEQIVTAREQAERDALERWNVGYAREWPRAIVTADHAARGCEEIPQDRFAILVIVVESLWVELNAEDGIELAQAMNPAGMLVRCQ